MHPPTVGPSTPGTLCRLPGRDFFNSVDNGDGTYSICLLYQSIGGPCSQGSGYTESFTSSTFTPRTSARVAVRVTVTAPGYEASTRLSSYATNPRIRITDAYSEVKVGTTLTAYPVDNWNTHTFITGCTAELPVWLSTCEKPVSYLYQWYRGDSRIPGATNSTYTTMPDDMGSRITVKVIAKMDGLPDSPEVISNWVMVAATHFVPKAGTDRWAGSSRLETATQIANNSSLRNASTAFIAYGNNFPDALAAAAAAGKLRAPILLVGDGANTAKTAIDYLNQMPNLTKVYLLGGESRVTKDTEIRIMSLLPAKDAVIRLWGSDRYETAAKIASEFFANANEVFLAAGYGQKFPDALAAASLAGNVNAPVLLTEEKAVPPAILQYLGKLPGPITVNLVGGTASVSDSVKVQIRQALPEKQITFLDRLAGDSRYETAAVIARAFETRVGTPTTLFIAAGENYPDALAGAPAAALVKAPVLHTAKDYLPKVVRDYVLNNPISSAIYLGGENTIPNANKDLLQTIISNRTGFKPVSSVALSPDFTLDVGKSQKVTPTFTPGDATFKNLVWTSSNTKVATVSAVGEVKAVGAGTATIQITSVDGGFKAKTTITVKS